MEQQYEQDIIKIMLADDHPLMRYALKEILEKQPDFKVIAEAANGEEALSLAAELHPNIVIMDIDMPKTNGIEATKYIKAKCPDSIILVLTIYEDNEHVMNILEAGAVGYLTKRAFAKEIIHSIRAAIAGDIVLSHSVSKDVINYALRYAGKSTRLNSVEKFSAKEMEIMRLAAKGLSNKEIALRLSLSQRTIKNLFSQIFLKLGVTSRTEAAIVCVREGILSMNDIN